MNHPRLVMMVMVQMLSVCFDGVVILDPGFGFSDGDTIEVDGDNGAELEPIFTNGSLTGVNIINPGIGYTQPQKIKINTRTGYNARVLTCVEIC